MLSLPSLRRRSCFAALLLLAALETGCVRPLASQQEFFLPTSGVADRIGLQTRYTLSHHRAVQVARHACRSKGAVAAAQGVTNVPDSPDSVAAAAGDEALAGLCASEPQPPAAAYGGVSNAYRRWVEEQVHDLPDAAETAASAAGGS